jgi:hypothetical protein
VLGHRSDEVGHVVLHGDDAATACFREVARKTRRHELRMGVARNQAWALHTHESLKVIDRLAQELKRLEVVDGTDVLRESDRPIVVQSERDPGLWPEGENRLPPKIDGKCTGRVPPRPAQEDAAPAGTPDHRVVATGNDAPIV